MNVGPQDGQDLRNGHNLILEPYSDLRARGREYLAGKWSAVVITVFVYMLLIEAVPQLLDLIFGTERVIDLSQYMGQSFTENLGSTEITVKESPVTGLYRILVLPPLTYGLSQYFLDIARNKACSLGDIFQGFEKFVKTILLSLYMYLFIILWALIPIAGIFLAIRAGIRYSMAYYIMCDQPELSIPMCVNESKRIMEGNKLRYLLLDLSFIGWFILAFICVAIIAAICAFIVIPIFGTESGQGVAQLLATSIGMLPVAVVLAYNKASDTAFYELACCRLQGETAYVRDM